MTNNYKMLEPAGSLIAIRGRLKRKKKKKKNKYKSYNFKHLGRTLVLRIVITTGINEVLYSPRWRSGYKLFI